MHAVSLESSRLLIRSPPGRPRARGLSGSSTEVPTFLLPRGLACESVSSCLSPKFFLAHAQSRERHTRPGRIFAHPAAQTECLLANPLAAVPSEASLWVGRTWLRLSFLTSDPAPLYRESETTTGRWLSVAMGEWGRSYISVELQLYMQ